MDKKFWAIVGAITVLFIGFLVFGGNKDAEQTSTKSAKPSSHIKGNGTKIALLEYGDFQCGPCASYYPIIAQVMQKYDDDLTFQFRHFPIPSLHQNAFAASRAAEAASKQGKFWEMYDKLFTNQDSWKDLGSANAVFKTYATEIGLNVSKYQTDFISSEVNDTIRADMSNGNSKGVDSTPTFFINGKKIETPANTIEAFSAVIDKEIAKTNNQ